MTRCAAALALILLSTSCASAPPPRQPAAAARAPAQTEILWDSWGVPHIYAADTPGLFHAFGWAQMASHGDLLLRSYGKARGRASEYWGEEHLPSDRWMHTVDVPQRAQRWYDAQSPEFRGYLDAFAAGINAYAKKHGELIDDEVEVVLPLNGVDVLAHAQRGIHVAFFAGPWNSQVAGQHLAKGSNGWAIGPSRAAAGNPMLLANPHLSWSDSSRFFEAHLQAPGVDIYGAAAVGTPVLAIAFNQQLGWTHTVNMTSPVSHYELTLEDGGYRFDGARRQFEERKATIRTLADDGTIREETQRTRWSVHGPLVAERGNKAIAMAAVGWDAPGLLQQWWDMGLAKTLAEFEAALRTQQVPVFTVIYADREGVHSAPLRRPSSRAQRCLPGPHAQGATWRHVREPLEGHSLLRPTPSGRGPHQRLASARQRRAMDNDVSPGPRAQGVPSRRYGRPHVLGPKPALRTNAR